MTLLHIVWTTLFQSANCWTNIFSFLGNMVVTEFYPKMLGIVLNLLISSWVRDPMTVWNIYLISYIFYNPINHPTYKLRHIFRIWESAPFSFEDPVSFNEPIDVVFLICEKLIDKSTSVRDCSGKFFGTQEKQYDL